MVNMRFPPGVITPGAAYCDLGPAARDVRADDKKKETSGLLFEIIDVCVFMLLLLLLLLLSCCCIPIQN